MPLKKRGSPTKLEVVKNSAFSMNPNVLAERFLTDWPNKYISIDDIHYGLKQMGIDNYSAEDLSILIDRLQAVGFSVSN